MSLPHCSDESIPMMRAADVECGWHRAIQRAELLAQHQRHVECGGEQYVVESELVGVGGWWVERRGEWWRGWEWVLIGHCEFRAGG